MPWCPKCRTEYENGFKTCNDCNADLVDELEQDKDDTDVNTKEVFLVSIANSIEAEIVATLLASYNIPVIKRYREAGGYLEIYMGGSTFGVDLFVPEDLLAKAKDIIDNKQEFAVEDIEQESTGQDSIEQDWDEEENIALTQKYKKKSRVRTWIILLIFIIPMLILLFTGFLYNLYHLVFG